MLSSEPHHFPSSFSHCLTAHILHKLIYDIYFVQILESWTFFFPPLSAVPLITGTGINFLLRKLPVPKPLPHFLWLISFFQLYSQTYLDLVSKSILLSPVSLTSSLLTSIIEIKFLELTTKAIFFPLSQDQSVESQPWLSRTFFLSKNNENHHF